MARRFFCLSRRLPFRERAVLSAQQRAPRRGNLDALWCAHRPGHNLELHRSGQAKLPARQLLKVSLCPPARRAVNTRLDVPPENERIPFTEKALILFFLNQLVQFVHQGFPFTKARGSREAPAARLFPSSIAAKQKASQIERWLAVVSPVLISLAVELAGYLFGLLAYPLSRRALQWFI